MFSQVLNQIRVNHPDSIDTHDLFMAAVTGMVHAADPHSYVLPATRLAPEKETAMRAGKLYPVPIRFAFYGGSPVVVSVAPGSEAATVDTLPGDELIAVDSQPVQAESAEELDISLAGPKGSTTKLSLQHRRLDGSIVTVERSVARERTEEATAIPAAFMLHAQVGYIRLTTFENQKAADDLHAALGRLEGRDMKRLVLDLRDNGGGSVDEAARVAGEFLPKGAIGDTSQNRKKAGGDKDTGRVGRAVWRHEKRDSPVVLVKDRKSVV